MAPKPIKPIVPAYLIVGEEQSLSGQSPTDSVSKTVSMLGIKTDGHFIATDMSGFVYAIELGDKTDFGREVTGFGQGTFVQDGKARRLQFVPVTPEVEDDVVVIKLERGVGAQRLTRPDLHPITVDPLQIAAKLGGEDAGVRQMFLGKIDNTHLTLTTANRLHTDSVPVDLTKVVLKSASGAQDYIRIKVRNHVFVAELKENVIGRVVTLTDLGQVTTSSWQKLFNMVKKPARDAA